MDDPISSKSSKGGTMVHGHLKDPIVIAGRTIAAAGTPVEIRILDSSAADIADTYGFVDIYFEPLKLADGRRLPLRTPIARLSPTVSSGHESTVAAEDTAGDIFVPYYSLWQIFRHGKNFVLGAGSVLPAKTEATLTARSKGAIAIVTPQPLNQSTESPNATFPVMPIATPFGPEVATPRPRTTPSPTPTPSPAPSESP
ncbi:MAG: hypothetical protein JO146_05295 [Candidatus Eremiobacteraeota bacterium]|nr:hypothetical protein [Candidatus Eremiobacteraeota bacterium]